MVRIVRLLLGLVLVLLIMDFAVANRTSVEVSLAPLPINQPLPVYAVFLIGLVVGAVIGGLMIWIGTLTRAGEARRLRSRVWSLENQLNILKEQDDQRRAAATRPAPRPAAPGAGTPALPKLTA